ncbi:hypothetical protein KGF57_003969 [Candida theae]|uniref:Uncharacterized protein n=1 Tax=Candida theae TaxID=1198502 RepID=A0AAD5BCX7_9ASCO|nr:uncharacterized protein KGF57_003969 [Candida theae]KAI5953760.1 hypothetical protein KGF57_003969 [Candida theae]
MQLLDLPIELLLKAIQLKEHLLTFPEDVVLFCLNLLSQIDQFELLVEVAYGDRAYKIANRLAPVNQNCLRIYELFGYWKTVRAMWSGDEYRHQYIFMPYYSFDGQSVLHICPPPSSEFILESRSSNIFHVLHVLNETDNWIWKYKCFYIHSIEVRMTIGEFLKLKEYGPHVTARAHPTVLKLYITDANKSVGHTESSDSMKRFFLQIVGMFFLDRVRFLSLQYNGTTTQLTPLRWIIERAPLLVNLNLNFEKLDITSVLEMMECQVGECYIQVRTDRSFYNTIKDKHKQPLWDIHIFENFVILNCVKTLDEIVPFSVKYPETSSRRPKSVSRFRRWLDRYR